jgi:WYL domain
MTTRDAVRSAIVGHRRLAFRYRGLPRIVNPVRLGLSGKGSWQLRAVQVGGESDSGRYGGGAPKLFDLELMSDVSVLDAEFRIPRQYEPGDSAFVRIDVEL